MPPPRHACCRSSSRAVVALGLFILVALGLPPAVCGHAQPVPDSLAPESRDARTLFLRGLTQSYLEDYDEAVRFFERALDRAPESAAILSALSEAEAGRDHPTTALYYARKARAQAPDVPYYHMALATLLEETNRLEEAASAYDTLLARVPAHRSARRALARLETRRERPHEALRHYEALTADSARTSVAVYDDMLSLYRQVDDEAGVKRTLNILVERVPDAPRYRRLLAQLYIRQQEYRNAIPLLESLRDETPHDFGLLSRLKMLYQKTGQPEKVQTLGLRQSNRPASPDELVARARSLYTKASAPDSARVARVTRWLRDALDQSPQHVGALDLLGRILLDHGEDAEAAALLERAVDANPRSPARWRRAASAFLAADSLEKAAALAEEGTLLFPGRPALLRIEGTAGLRAGDYATARDRFQEALARVDTTTTSHETRARLYTGLGRALDRLDVPTDARTAHATAVRLAPERAESLTYYARHLAAQSPSSTEALRLARRATELAPSSPQALGTLGWVYARRGATEQAAVAFDDALATGRASAWTYEQFGDLQHSLGNEARARRYWRKALARTPHRTALKEKLRSSPTS